MHFDDRTTGSLAAPSPPREPRPIPVTQPQGVSDEHWAKISADTSFMSWLAGQPMVVRYEQLGLRLSRLESAESQREDIAALSAEWHREREAAAAHLAAHPTDAKRIASLEAALIELRVRVATLEAAQPRKPAKVTRIARATHSTPPDAA